MITELKVFRGLPIPVDYAATMKYAVLAKSNGGKTYLTLKMEEQLCDAGAFFVTLDPVGKHWALRVGKDGKPKDGKHDVYVLGGLHGDVPLEAGSGALIADTVLDHPGRYVLDVSQFDTDSDQDRFALDFGKRLFRRKAKDPGFPLLLILEEAESFIPQQPRPNQAAMLGAYGKIARQGRNHGLGLWLVAQRSASLNKGVLSQCDVLVAKTMNHNRDIDAVDEWVKNNGTPEQRDQLVSQLASLPRNEAYVWAPDPDFLNCFERVKILPRVTFDSSANVKHGAAQERIELRPLDVGALGEAIAATAERAKADDPKELRKRITELERNLKSAENDFAELERLRAAKTAVVKERVEVPVLPDGHVDELEAVRNQVKLAETSSLVEAAASLERARTRLETLIAKAQGVKRASQISAQTVAAPVARDTRTMSPTPRLQRPAASPGTPTDGTLGKAHRAVLTVLAQYGPVSKTRLAMQAGYSANGGGFNNALGKLRSLGYITSGTDPIQITQEGINALGSYDELPRGRALLDHWLGHQKVGRAGQLVLETLAEHGPMDKQQLAEATGYEASGGGFNNALGALRTLQLVAKGSPVSLTPEFREAIR